MSDQLMFSAERDGDHVLVVVEGTDADGIPVRFSVDPELFADNLARQLRFVCHVAGANRHFAALVDTGFVADQAWTVVERSLPAPTYYDTWATA